MTTKAEHVRAQPNDDRSHHCHATGCHRQVKPAHFMCRDHWQALPPAHRSAIWTNYRPGQERDKNPSARYLDAARAAIKYLEDVEKIKNGELPL